MDTHRAFKRLVNAGLQENIAETVIEIVDETRRSDFEKLATKEDLKSALLSLSTSLNEKINIFNTNLREGIAAVNTNLKEEIAAVNTNLKEEIAAVRNITTKLSGDVSLLKWMVGVSISMSIAIIAKLFFG